jgi:acetyl-CoA C-acetyltransferase
MARIEAVSKVWLAAGVRTPFSKLDGPLAGYDAITLSNAVIDAMLAQADGPADLAVWGAVAPNLGWSNIAREVMLEAGADPAIPAYSTIMACATSMVGAFQAAGMVGRPGLELALVGGVESMSHVQIGLSEKLSDWIRRFQGARSLGRKLAAVSDLGLGDIRVQVPGLANRVTGKTMGEHTEEMAKTWGISREDQDAVALASHKRAILAWRTGFFDDLVSPLPELHEDSTPRSDTSLEALAHLPLVFDRTSGKGTLTAGNSSPLSDGAAGVWVATDAGLERLPASLHRARLIDWEVSAIDLKTEGLLMAPAYGIPRLLARHGLTLGDIDLWEIHEAFAAQVLCHIAALQDRTFLSQKVGVGADLGAFPTERMNPNGGSVALGHPFGATGARILSQAVKELAAKPAGALAIVSICTDGGQGAVALLQSANEANVAIAAKEAAAERTPQHDEALLEEALEESFPASDPPALP